MYISHNNFRFGLDTRRSELSSVPGSLMEALDGHITQGGEFEKRKAFVKTALPANVYGFQPTSTGIYVFGTAATVNGLPTPPCLYQQLLHPKEALGLGAVAMSSIVASDQFNNLPIAVAKFADGNVYAYYNGVLITDFTDGLVDTFMTTNAQLAQNLVTAINNSVEYTAVQDAGTAAHEFDAFSTPGASYSAAVSVASAAHITVNTLGDVSFTGGVVSSTDGIQPTAGQFVYIGGQKYTFQTALAAAYDVKIDANIQATLTNLYLAINASGVAGTNYYAGTAANTNVYASAFQNQQWPNFTISSLVANVSGLIQNNTIGVGYTQESDTVPRAIAVQSVGQFKIQAFASATYASATIAKDGTTTMPSNGDTLTVNGIVYTFTTSGSPSVGQIVIPAAGVGAVSRSDVLMLNIINMFNNLQYYRIGVTLVQAGIPPFTGAGLTNTFFSAGTLSGTGGAASFVITATTIGSAPNAWTITKTGSPHLTIPGTFSGGVTSVISSITVGPTDAYALITSTGVNPANNDTITIGATQYTFVTAAPAALNQIFIGANAATTMMNLVQAINYTGIAGTDYNVAGPHTQVLALPALNGNVLQIIARQAGTAGNAISLASGSTVITVSGATLTGGNDSVALLSAGVAGLSRQTAADFAYSVVSAINVYSPTSRYTAQLVGNTIYIYSLAGNSYSNNAKVTVTVSGQVCIGFCAFEFAMPAVIAGNTQTSYNGLLYDIQINGQKQLNGVQYSVDTAGGAHHYNTISLMCSAVATDFNANTGTAGVAGNAFTMVAQENILYISKLVTSSDDAPINVNVILHTVGIDQMFVSALGQDNLYATVTPTAVNFIRHTAGGSFQRDSLLSPSSASTYLFDAAFGVRVLAAGVIGNAFGFGSSPKMVTDSYSPIVCTCQATGGYPPYKYSWAVVSGDQGFVASAPTQASVTFFRQDTAGAQSAMWGCTVTDSLGNSVLSNLIRVYQP